MELTVRNGDYLPDGRGGFRRAEGAEELLQRVLWKLTARRGSFPFLPNLGSRLYTLHREKPGDWTSLAERYVAEALADESELSVTAVTVTPDGAGGAAVEVSMNYGGDVLSLTVEVV